MNLKFCMPGSKKRYFLVMTIAICIFALLGMSLAGCSGGNKLSDKDQTGTNTSLSTSEPADNTTKQTEASASTQEAIPAVAVNLVPNVAEAGAVQPIANFNEIKVVDYVQKLKPTDYVYMWWPKGFQAGQNDQLFFQSGKYGIALDVRTGVISKIGAIVNPLSQNDAVRQSNDVITSLTHSSTSFSLKVDGKPHQANRFTGIDNSPLNTSRLIDSGRFMQRAEIPVVKYQDADQYRGRIEIAAQPDFFSIVYQVSRQDADMADAELSFSLDIDSSYTNAVWSSDKRAITFKKDDGSGITVVATDAKGVVPSMAFEAGKLTFTQGGLSARKGKFSGFSIIVIPSLKSDITDADSYLEMEKNIKITYNRLKSDGSLPTTTPKEAVYDPVRGVYSIKLSALGANMSKPEDHNKYNRVRFTLSNPTGKAIRVPVVFDDPYGSSTAYIVGGAPMLRDAVTMEPIGIPVQISKNWHESAWYHLYTLIEVPAQSAVEYEYTCASSKWGEAFAASHAQLCLIGYGGNQLWDESAMGSFGESITYDPDINLGRSMVDDVRPFLVDASKDGKSGKWTWTGNVGGADFLVYFDKANSKQILVRNKTNYIYQAPNLTNVVYAGMSRDGNIEAEITVQMGRTDDIVRTYYKLKYTFVKDTVFNRLALFQMAADGYGDNSFRKYAYGNEADVLFDEKVPLFGPIGYENDSVRSIEAKGDSPWFMLYDSSNIPEELGNAMFTVRDYNAVINGTTYTQPYFNIVGTQNGVYQKAFELGVPKVADNMIKAGSTIEATVEYSILPSNKAQYYGPSDYLNATPANEYNTASMAVKQAKDNDVAVKVSRGTLKCEQPVEITVDGATGAVAQFSVTGGLGYTPVTFKGLNSFDGWKLEKKAGSSWKRVDQSVIGNDYWQCYYDSATDTYDLIFNIKNSGTTEYRLVK